MVYHPNELSYLWDILAGRHVDDRFAFFWVGMDAGAINEVAAEVDTGLVDLTFSLVQSYSTVLDPFECCVETKVVFLLRGSKNQHVIHHANCSLNAI